MEQKNTRMSLTTCGLTLVYRSRDLFSHTADDEQHFTIDFLL